MILQATLVEYELLASQEKNRQSSAVYHYQQTPNLIKNAYLKYAAYRDE